MNPIDPGAAATTALILQGRTLKLLVEKGLISDTEAHSMILATGDQIAPDNPVQRQQAQQALMAVFPSVRF